jgi:hypothetical protein
MVLLRKIGLFKMPPLGLLNLDSNSSWRKSRVVEGLLLYLVIGPLLGVTVEKSVLQASLRKT